MRFMGFWRRFLLAFFRVCFEWFCLCSLFLVMFGFSVCACSVELLRGLVVGGVGRAGSCFVVVIFGGVVFVALVVVFGFVCFWFLGLSCFFLLFGVCWCCFFCGWCVLGWSV